MLFRSSLTTGYLFLVYFVYERVYNHYATRLGLGMPYVKEVLETKVRPENAGTDIAHLGYGTFLYCSEGFE